MMLGHSNISARNYASIGNNRCPNLYMAAVGEKEAVPNSPKKDIEEDPEVFLDTAEMQWPKSIKMTDQKEPKLDMDEWPGRAEDLGDLTIEELLGDDDLVMQDIGMLNAMTDEAVAMDPLTELEQLVDGL